MGFCCFAGLDFLWREKVKLDISPLKTPQTGHQCMFAQVENKSKRNVYENTTGSTKPAESVFWFSLQGFLRQPERPRSGISYSPNLPVAGTKFTFEQSEQTLELRRLFLCFMREIFQHLGKAHRRAAVPNSNVLLRFLFFFCFFPVSCE